jgi:hypothetical protein
MTSPGRFDPRILDLARKAKIIGLRAGRQSHRFIGLWVVVTQNRVFVRSWALPQVDGIGHCWKSLKPLSNSGYAEYG